MCRVAQVSATPWTRASCRPLSMQPCPSQARVGLSAARPLQPGRSGAERSKACRSMGHARVRQVNRPNNTSSAAGGPVPHAAGLRGRCADRLHRLGHPARQPPPPPVGRGPRLLRAARGRRSRHGHPRSPIRAVTPPTLNRPSFAPRPQAQPVMRRRRRIKRTKACALSRPSCATAVRLMGRLSAHTP